MTPIFQKPEIFEKMWGKEIWIHNSPLYCGKILEFNKDFFSSLHFHRLKTETWYVLNGHLIIEYLDDDEIIHKKDLYPGDVVHINAKSVHKLIAIENSQVLEVSTQHFDDDSIRLQPSGQLKNPQKKLFPDEN